MSATKTTIQTWVSTSSNVDLSDEDRFRVGDVEIYSIRSWSGTYGHGFGVQILRDGTVGRRERRVYLSRTSLPESLLDRLDIEARDAIRDAL